MMKHMKNRSALRVASMLLALVVLVGMIAPASAIGAAGGTAYRVTQADNREVSSSLLSRRLEEQEIGPRYADTDLVRVSIVGQTAATIAAGFPAQSIASDAQAQAYRARLDKEQQDLQARIERATGSSLDVVWNLTLAANVISANVPYGRIAEIEKVPGVQRVYLESRYDPAVVDRSEAAGPNMATSSSMIGSGAAYAAGYTGAGMRIAVIDTGVDTDHQSFDAGAFDYSLEQQAAKSGKTVADYKLLDAEQIGQVLSQLHVKRDLTAQQLYCNTKIPFGYNYVDMDTDITHDNDKQGEHGSHVAGIAAANAYLPKGDGTYESALDAVYVQGVAPDAQMIVMKVFGKNGGAYESDYMVAIEDAIVLGCDSINLSLGSSNVGNSTNSEDFYQKIMDNLTNSGVVVTMSAGNNGAWPAYAYNGGALYSQDVSMSTAGSPGTYTNSLSIASVNNAGYTGAYFSVGNQSVFYSQVSGYSNLPLITLAGEQRYVLIDGLGSPQDWAAVGDALQGAVAVCSRGTITFAEKGNAAIAAGAIATVVYNNEAGTINPDLSGYTDTAPFVTVTQADGTVMRSAAAAVTDGDGNVLYYQGTLTVQQGVGSTLYDSDYYTMSEFSSWGVPGSLEMKPEITAPGGSIYSVDGSGTSGDGYKTMSGTSMAAPQVAGLAALAAQYVEEQKLAEKTGLTARTLIQSLLMSTAVPLLADHGDGTEGYYPILQQGAGLADVSKVISADSYILMDADATRSCLDGKVKVELGDDPEKKGEYTFSFTLHNLTAQEKTYALSADFFTQGLFTDVINANQDLGDYMDTRTAPLNLDVTFSTGANVTVPANGSAKVTVTAALTAEQKAALQEKYPCGAYLQGFVFAKSASTPEGIQGTEHSIPVLGFYGSWTDSSMFDVGSYAEYQSGAESRTPYLGNPYTNCLGVTYSLHPGDVYAFGGNPIIQDKTYMPERNAFNNANGDVLSSVVFSPIRNAAATRFQVRNVTQNQALATTDYGSVYGAFYSETAQSWYNTQANLSLFSYIPTANEGDSILATMTLAPEYYVRSDGSVDWNALGQGATLSVPMVIDNTAPELVGGDSAVTVQGSTMTVTARDNRYIAGVALYNGSGSTVYASTGSKADIQPGETAQYDLNLSGIVGSRFLLQVYDYAMNTTTYIVDRQIGDPGAVPDMIGFNVFQSFWTSLTTTSTSTGAGVAYAESSHTFLAGTVVDSWAFGATSTGSLYVMPLSDLTDTTLVADLGVLLYDMTYNAANDTIYAVDQNSNLVTVDKLTGAIGTIGRIGSGDFLTNTLACDRKGTFYCNQYDTGYVYRFTLDTISAPEQVACVWATPENFSSFSAQSMEVDPETGHIIWTSYEYIWVFGGMYRFLYYYMFEISPENDYSVTRCNDLHTEITALLIPDQSGGGSGSWAAPTQDIASVQISHASLQMWKGSQESLYAIVQPWTAENREVTWHSSDESVATVNSQGTVRAVGDGVCQITATSKLDSSVSSACTVTVSSVPITLSGVLQDKSGKSQFFTWDMEHDDTYQTGAALDTDIVSAAYDSIEDQLYVMDPKSTIHRINPMTGKTEATAASETSLWDMQFSSCYSAEGSPKLSGVYETFFYACKDPMHFGGSKFNASSNLSAWGVSCFVASASMGHVSYPTQDGNVDTERFVLLDDGGGLWNIYIYWDAAQQEYLALITIRYAASLPESFPGYGSNKFCSMVADETGALYLSVFDGTTSNLYRLDVDDTNQTYKASYLCNMGNGVWPVSLCSVRVHGDCDHVNTEIRGAVPATCTEDGYTGDTYCTDCGERIARGSVIPATGHTMGEWTVSEPVTCLTDGLETRSCTRCDYTETRVIEATGHVFEASVAAPTCEADGYTQHTCTKCGYNYRDTFTPALGHSYQAATVAPTCTEAGYTRYTCSACQHSYIDDITPSLGHNYEAAVTAPTHDKMGYTTYTCTACGHSYVSDYTDALGHSYTPSVTKEPTCTEEGLMTFTCDCGEHYTQPIPRTDHQYEDTVQEPDCTHMGRTVHTCTVCGHHYEDAFVDALGHELQTETVAATCLGFGYTEHRCSRCDFYFVSDLQQPLEHSWSDWTVTETPDCFHDGVQTRTCSACGLDERITLPASSQDCPSAVFTDLDSALWYHESVDFILRAGLMQGIGDNLFAPGSSLTRGQLVTILYRLEGASRPEVLIPFQDVEAGRYYTDAVAWAYQNHIVQGMTETQFAPNEPVTREQLATILYRYTAWKGVSTEQTADLSAFPDGSAVKPYAQDAMAWAVGAGLIQGSYNAGVTTLNPRDHATRAQIAAVLMRYLRSK